MYYFIPLCVAVLLHGTAALDGCNDTCSSILAVNGSGEFDVDCNSGVTAEYFKCISASTGCDDIAKSRIAEHNIIPQHGQKRGGVVDYHDRVLGLDAGAGFRASLREALTRLRRRYL